ncbi:MULTISPECIES: glycosyltransferase family 4 protein [Clostridia]|uniref:glycosyltransferase family 4 protein n=1 Tax=Clostridia TaxID=186801 RepID=UPI0025FDC901|nr:glycosyltransferase family 4 protein [uncultured Clostridium sp.]
MKVLLINKYNFIKGGSEIYTFGLKDMLIEDGHEVIDFSMKSLKNQYSKYSDYFVEEIDYSNNELLNKVKNSINLIYSREACHKLEELIKKTKPDIAHVNLIYHQLTPSILHILKKFNIPIVFTSHDYKVICPNYKLYNNGLCDKCINGTYINCFKEKCHKNSKAFSLLLTIEAYVHKYLKSYDLIDKIICPSEFMKEKLIRGGLSRDKLKKVPNFINPQYYINSEKYRTINKEKYLLYYGRLSSEKGLLNLMEALKLVKKEVKLKIIGTGPHEQELREYIKENNIRNVEFLGFKNGDELFNEISKAYCTILPAIWHEVFGLTIIESFAFGTPVIGANLGGISELITNKKTGFTFNNVEELAMSIDNILELSDSEYRAISNSCILEAEKYSPKIIYKQILDVYKDLVKKY